MGTHLIDNEFQSDKYPTTPRGKVPLSVRDPMAQDLLFEYAQRRSSDDREFATDLKTALILAGFKDVAGEHFLEAELLFRFREWYRREAGRLGFDKVVTAKFIVVLELETGSEPDHIVAKIYERSQHDTLLGDLPEKTNE